MAITTYSELQTAIQNWLDDMSISAYATDFITLGESRIKRDLRVRQMETRTTDTLSEASRYLSLPAGFVANQRLHLQTTPIHELKYVSKDQITQYFQSAAGKPNFYTIIGTQFEFNRIPDSAYTIEIGHYKLTSLSDSDTTNEIFPEFADLYLYASLAEAAEFNMSDENRVWETKYEIGLKKAKMADQISRIPESYLVMRLDIVPE